MDFKTQQRVLSVGKVRKVLCASRPCLARRLLPGQPVVSAHSNLHLRPQQSNVRVYQVDRPQVDVDPDSVHAETTTLHKRIRNVTEMWPHLAEHNGDLVASREPHNAEAVDMTFSLLHLNMSKAAAGLKQLGLIQGSTVALIAESSSRWILADQAVMLNGAATAVRGSASPPEELAYIVGHAKCTGIIFQDVQALKNVAPYLSKPGMPQVKFVVVMWGSVDASAQALFAQHSSAQIVTWQDLLELGNREVAIGAWKPANIQPEHLATLVYTSGTTGHPKGVMLTHGNLAYQVNNLSHFLEVRPGDTALALLPPWHIYQRSCTYYIFASAGQLVFTTIRKFRDDLQAYPPDHLVCVPLVLDTLYTRVMHRLASATPIRKMMATAFIALSTAYIHARRVVEGAALQHALVAPSFLQIAWASLVATVLAPIHQLAVKLVYSKVREALGVRRTIVSGGGSLASHLDDFFEVLGLPVLNGWGLTETSPVLACRRVVQNVRGTVGPPVPGTEVRVVDPETLTPLGPGSRGLLLARGPGIMAGYLADDAATAKAFRAGAGWLDTGDLGWVVPELPHSSKMSGMIVLTGRAKDTIVLISGKNIEPQPVEDAVCASPLIKQALLVGQDKRELGLVIFPDLDMLEEKLRERQAAASEANASTAAATSPEGATTAASQHPLVRAATAAQLQELMLPDVNKLNSARHDYTAEQHIAHVAVITRGVLTVEDGTLTRTMKLRRAEVCAKYAREVNTLIAHLRG